MRPLEGIRILDFSQLHGAVFATMLLADLGAEVIKVEKPGGGDPLRAWPPMKDGRSAYHAYLNRGKKSVTVDISSDEGRETILGAVRGVDVVCENFRCGTMEKYGLGYEDLKKVKPDIIYAVLTGYGRTGVLKDKSCFEINAQARSGMLAMTGEKDAPPVAMGAHLGNLFGGMRLAMGINMALIHRNKTGEGQFVEVACTDSLFSALEDGLVNYTVGGFLFERKGNKSLAISPYDIFRTTDGYVSIAASTEPQWEKLCVALGLEHMKDSPEYRTNEQRCLHYDVGLKDLIEGITCKMTKYEVECLLSEAGVPCAPVCRIDEAVGSAQTAAREMLIEIDGDAGPVKQPGIPAKLYGTPGHAAKSKPVSGSDEYGAS